MRPISLVLALSWLAGCPDDPEPDDGCSSGETPTSWFRDADGDGYGLDGDERLACVAPEGYTPEPGDCDDARAVVNPGETERCNGDDDDCDGTVDGPGADGFGTWHRDADGDGFGDPTVPTEGCVAPSAHVLDDTDCDDASAAIHPGATETCDAVDEDCDGTPDEDAVDASTWTVDADGDGFGDDATAVVSCEPVPDTVAFGGDCDDADPSRNPGLDEICGGPDEDCDGLVDDDDPGVVGPAWYADDDGDGHGDPGAPERACVVPAGHVALPDDCDDGDAAIHVGAPEIPSDGVDQDCDGGDPPDFDGDGWSTADDCDDTDPNIAPTATDIIGDDIDQNCDGVDGTDIDRDGEPSIPSGGLDCDDHDASVYGGAPEILGDGIDNACAGEVDIVRLDAALGAVVGIREPDRLGDAVTGADYDGDGDIDLVVGAPQRYGGSDSGNSVGHVSIHDVPLDRLVTEADASAVITGTSAIGHFGEWVGTLPDLDGDGLPELAVGADEYDTSNRSESGAVFVWFGLPTGAIDDSTADLTIIGNTGMHLTQVSVADLTDDGVLDLAVPWMDESFNIRGGIEVVAGPFAPGPIDAPAVAVASFSTSQVQSRLSVVAPGDFDGDGVADLALGDWSFTANGGPNAAGRILIEHGPVAGAYSVDTDADAGFAGNVANGFFGEILTAGDLDGDGIDEVLSSSGNFSDPSYRGRIWVFSGPFAGNTSVTAATATIEGDTVGHALGSDLEFVGDLDGDGSGDLLVGSQTLSQAYFLRGPFSGALRLADVPHGTIVGTVGGGLGAVDTLALIPDVTGDGAPDLWLGEPTSDAEVSEGGSASLLPGAW